MTSNIRGMAVAIRNSNDGISMAQTAEGALGEVTNILQRMRELTVQSSNGTLGAGDRSSLQAEMNQLTTEVRNIAKTATFTALKPIERAESGEWVGKYGWITVCAVSLQQKALHNEQKE